MAISALMQFLKHGKSIGGEGRSEINGSDPLERDFKGTPFFEIDDFDFSLELNEGESARSSGPKLDLSKIGDEQHREALQKAFGGGKGRFAEYVRSGKDAAAAGFEAQMEPFSFTKQIDTSSTMMITSCYNRDPFDSAVLVKRRDAGLSSTSTTANYAFLRMEFKDVLIVAVDWDGQELVKEKVKFVCRNLRIDYVAQATSGRRGAQPPPARLAFNKSAGGNG